MRSEGVEALVYEFVTSVYLFYVLYGGSDLRLEEVPELSIKPGHLKVKVCWCGICGSDVHEYEDGPLVKDENGKPVPSVMGHEFSGVVVEVGEGVKGWKLGDRLTAEGHIVCKDCYYCNRGEYTHCRSHRIFGVHGTPGAFAEYVVVDADFCHHLPDALSDESAALVEPIAVGFHSLSAAGFRQGMTATVLGAGPIGLGVIASLRAAGARLIIAVVRKSIRQEYAKRLGADYVIDPTEVDAVEEIRRLTDGLGTDVSFETFGVDLGLDIGLACIKSRGTCTVISLRFDRASYEGFPLVEDEKRIVGANMYSHEDFETVIKMLTDGRIPADAFITKRISLDELDREGFGTLLGPEKKKHVKIIVTPDPSLL